MSRSSDELTTSRQRRFSVYRATDWIRLVPEAIEPRREPGSGGSEMRFVNRLSMLAMAAALLAGGAAPAADDDPAVPADQVIAAIRIAVATQPGNVLEAEVERDRGRTVVEVKIIAKDGRRTEVKVDVEKNEVVGWQK
jgi:hypothetical protein